LSIYKHQILDHYKNPRNFGKLKDADVVIKETNASCGDETKIYIKFSSATSSQLPAASKVKEIKFKGTGCAVSMAAASMLTEYIKGKKASEILKLDKDDMFKLLGIKVGPGRVRCATLALEAVKKGINQARPGKSTGQAWKHFYEKDK